MRRFLASLALLAALCLPAWAERATEGGPKHVDGTEVQCDLPLSEWIKNVGGRDGAGLCVFTSIEHSARWQNEESLIGFQKKMRNELGGGYPEKVDRMLAKHAPGVKYVQYSGNDPSILDLAIKTGRMPSVTYSYSERYGGRVAHMVNLVHLDDRLACVLDNNFIGPEKLEWMSRAEFLRRWRLGGPGWCVILLSPPPSPIPINSVELLSSCPVNANRCTDSAGAVDCVAHAALQPWLASHCAKDVVTATMVAFVSFGLLKRKRANV